MKTISALLLILTSTAFANSHTIPDGARQIQISHVVVGPVGIASREVPCRIADSDLTCYQTTATRDMVTLTVSYTSNPILEDESFEVNFPVETFSDSEMKRLTAHYATDRVIAAKKIFALNIKRELRQGTRNYCPYEWPNTCRAGEEWTTSYRNYLKVVEVLKR